MNIFALSPPLTQPTMPPDVVIVSVLTAIVIIILIVAFVGFLKKKSKK